MPNSEDVRNVHFALRILSLPERVCGVYCYGALLKLTFFACPAGMGTQWKGMGLSLMKLDLFRQSILRSDEALKNTGLKVSDLLLQADENTFDDTVHAFVGLAAIQVRLKRLVEGVMHSVHVGLLCECVCLASNVSY